MTTATLSPGSANAVGSAKLEDLGYNFLRNYKVALDYPNETLSLFTP